ncbi:28S ribosomal protein S15, mitochondrial [Vespa velutina]|uniref:28S ribosomal protein S15, mitochondrial n=1 Tax=Vespa velutina TaxID=202808 RepID=UPI001FB4259F|nr:28S ribosomal protein S15, mitochondrial [Vespa velutina]
MNTLVNCCKYFSKITLNTTKHQYFVRKYAVHLSDYNINWVRPKKICITKPEKSGDLGIPHDVKPTDLLLGYDKSKELQDADEIVKKLVSLEFQPRREIINMRREKILELVKRHKLDRGSTEARIASMTSEILQLQEIIKKHPRDKKKKVFLKELIEKRNKYLRILRKWDYKRYEWILEKLNLFYKETPINSVAPYRKDSLRKLTQKLCDKIKQEKLDAYKAELKKQQKLFYKQKIKDFIFIKNEELELGLEPTITEDDIENIKKKFNEINNEETM